MSICAYIYIVFKGMSGFTIYIYYVYIYTLCTYIYTHEPAEIQICACRVSIAMESMA